MVQLTVYNDKRRATSSAFINREFCKRHGYSSSRLLFGSFDLGKTDDAILVRYYFYEYTESVDRSRSVEWNKGCRHSKYDFL